MSVTVADLTGPFDPSLMGAKNQLGEQCFAAALHINKKLASHGHKLHFSGKMFSILSSAHLPQHFFQKILFSNQSVYENLNCDAVVEQERDQNGNVQMRLSPLSTGQEISTPQKKDIHFLCKNMKAIESTCTSIQAMKSTCNDVQAGEKTIHDFAFTPEEIQAVKFKCDEVGMMESLCEQIQEAGSSNQSIQDLDSICQKIENMKPISTVFPREKDNGNLKLGTGLLI